MESVADRKVVFLKLDDVLPNRFQPRIKFDEQALYELSQSIKEHGVLSPITVRPLGNKYEIIAGERRYKASTMAGLTTIPAMVVNMNDKESAEIALIENVQRKDLTPIEEAISYKKIFDMNIGISQEALAKKIGKSQSAIANKLRLLHLSDEVQEALLENKISERHARSLLRIKDKKIQNMLLDKIIKERLTVRKTDEEIIDMLNKNKDIEILDFELGNEPEKTEQIDNPLNRFENLYNLPKAQIVEDRDDEFIPTIPEVKAYEPVEPIKPVVEPVSAVSEPVNNNIDVPVTNVDLPVENTISQTANTNVNPGFLDISKIEKEASDINSSSNKISLEELLRMPNDNTVETKEENDFNFEPVKENNTTNRFFSLLNEDDTTNNQDNLSTNSTEVEEPRLEDNSLQSIADNNTDLNFDTKFIPQEKTFLDNIDLLDKKIEEEETKPDFSFDDDIFNKSVSETVQTTSTEPSVETNDYLSTLFSNPVSNETSSVANEESVNDTLNTDLLNGSITDLPSLNSIEESTNNSLIPENIVENNSEIVESNEPNIDNEENLLNPINIDEELINDIPTNDIIEDEAVEEELVAPEPVSAMPEIKPVPPVGYTPVYDLDDEVTDENTEEVFTEERHSDNSKYGAADLKTIINTMRKCAETIEKYGYVIDTEEFDFEDMYQVIFKVQKKQ